MNMKYEKFELYIKFLKMGWLIFPKCRMTITSGTSQFHVPNTGEKF